MAPEAAAREISGHAGGGGKAGILFGRERWGLTNDEVARANRIITFPVNPGFASLNLAQAVLLMGYEWFKLATAGELPFAMPERSERASSTRWRPSSTTLCASSTGSNSCAPPRSARPCW